MRRVTPPDLRSRWTSIRPSTGRRERTGSVCGCRPPLVSAPGPSLSKGSGRHPGGGSPGQYGEAVVDYDRIAELAPDDPTGYYLRGYVYAKLGEASRGVEDFGRAIALDPGNIDARYQRASLYHNLGEPDKVVRDYDEIIRLQRDNSNTLGDRHLAAEEAERG